MIIVILFIVNLPVFWGLFYIFFGSWDKFRDTFESAIEEINKNAKKLVCLELTVIPVVRISWDAEIS